MIKLIKSLLLTTLLASASLTASEKTFLPICSATKAKKLLRKIPPEEKRDKVKHCQMSCMLTLRCPSIDVYTFGLMKEFYDLFTKGDADTKDIRANRIGIRFVTRGVSTSDEQCYEACANFNWYTQ
jgi:hypothetical protein